MPKHTTEGEETMTNTPDELDDIINELWEAACIYGGNESEADPDGCKPEAKTKLQALIYQERREARIDELEKLKNYDRFVFTLSHLKALRSKIEERIAQLKGGK